MIEYPYKTGHDLSVDDVVRAMANSYSPYSNYRVGAVAIVKTTERNVGFMGTNVENASYGLTLCAERSAISQAVSISGAKPGDFLAMIVSAPPCGACRQWIAEFKIEKVYFPLNGDLNSKDWVEYHWKDLLPDSFDFTPNVSADSNI